MLSTARRRIHEDSGRSAFGLIVVLLCLAGLGWAIYTGVQGQADKQTDRVRAVQTARKQYAHEVREKCGESEAKRFNRRVANLRNTSNDGQARSTERSANDYNVKNVRRVYETTLRGCG